MNGKAWKATLQNGAVDGASVLIFIAITTLAAQGFVTLYTAYYNTAKLPTPDVFQASAQQFTFAISLVYLLIQTRKHRTNQEPKKEG